MPKRMSLETYLRKLEQFAADHPWMAGITKTMAERARLENAALTRRNQNSSGLPPVKSPRD